MLFLGNRRNVTRMAQRHTLFRGTITVHGAVPQAQSRVAGPDPAQRSTAGLQDFRTKPMAAEWARRKENAMRRGTAIDTTLAQR